MDWVCKTIRNEWDYVKSRSLFIIGNVRRVKFQNDRWCGDLSLEESFLSLLSIVIVKGFMGSGGVGSMRGKEVSGALAF